MAGFSTALRILADVGKPVGEREDLINDLMTAASKVTAFESQLNEAIEHLRNIAEDNQTIKAMLSNITKEPVVIVEPAPDPDINVKPSELVVENNDSTTNADD